MTKEQDFLDFHNRNTKVYTEFARLTRMQIDKGVKWPLKAKNIIDKVRRNRKIRTTAMREGKPKIDNNYIAFYARMFMKLNPQHNGVFRVKKMKDVSKHVERIGMRDTHDHY